MMPLPIGKIAEAAGKITESIAGSFTSLFKRKEGIMAKEVDLKEVEAEVNKVIQDHILELAKVQQAEYEAMLKDTANAREQNISIQESDKASWLSKNVAYCIDIFVIVIWGFLTIYLIGNSLKIIKTSQVDLTGIYGLYAAVTGVAMTIINFHRGSSRGSEDKQKHLNEMMKNK